MTFLAFLEAHALQSPPHTGSGDHGDGCDVTAKSCEQDGSIFDLTQSSMPGEQSGDQSDNFRPGEWNPSFMGPADFSKDRPRRGERDNMNEGSLRGGSIDPAYPGAGGNTPTSIGTVDSYRQQ